MPYNFTVIEKKWQKYWQENKTFKALDPPNDPAVAGQMPKAYVLDMFPYPSGAGLHVGHPLGYLATDILSRYLRMTGRNVLHPMGWDAFGLPAEQYAIKNNVHPAETTKKNIATFRRQLDMLGMGYDWDREIATTDPNYYKWTQWIFLQLFNSYFDPIDQKAKPIAHLISELENNNYLIGPDGSVHLADSTFFVDLSPSGNPTLRQWQSFTPEEQRDILDGLRLAYTDEFPVNWCPALGTVLANEEVIDGKSEVGGFPVEKRPLRQWMLRITAYADRLLNDLDQLNWPESLKDMQRNWIGRSVGAEVDFELSPSPGTPGEGRGEGPSSDMDDDSIITVFTTRPDTLYGATYMVLAPEHPLIDRITTPDHRDSINAYRSAAATRSERDRLADTKDKTGAFTGAYAINPVNDEKLPIYIADYVLMGYGTGAIMAVPAHDERDFAFAKEHNLPIKQVVAPVSHMPPPVSRKAEGTPAAERAFTDEGIAINSPTINGLKTPEAKEKITDLLSAEGVARKSIRYKLRDWLFSRQRYWGEPFPIILDENNNAYALDESELPLTLPSMQDFKPTGTPEPPLSKAKDWINYSPSTSFIQDSGLRTQHSAMHRETNVMPQWAGSCWYYLRYLDPKNNNRFVDPAKEKYWMPVDLYVGGAEHAVLHLLYARFWHKVLFDLGHVSTPEPFARLVNQGRIVGETEFHVFENQEGVPVSTTDVRDIREEATTDKPIMVATHKDSGEKLIGKRLAEDDVERKGTDYFLKSNPQIKIDARSFKMSKSRGNVVNPDDIVRDYGADAFRLYEMYMGPLEAQKPWNTRDIIGMTRFLNSVWRNLVGDEERGEHRVSGVGSRVSGQDKDKTPPSHLPDTRTPNPEPRSLVRIENIPIPDSLDAQLHRTIKKVGEDISALRFNTAIAELIKLNNEMVHLDVIPRDLAETFTLLLSPFAPHISEEIWLHLGHTKTLARRPWPTFDESKLIETTIELPVQVNGKLRGKITVPADATEESILTTAATAPGVSNWLDGKTIRKKLYVPKKLVNFVVG